MKKAKIIVMALAIAMAFTSAAFAKNGLSVSLGFGINPDGAGMAATIMKDGEEGQVGSVLGKVLMPENELLSLKHSEIVPGMPGLVSKVTEGGPMMGLNMEFQVRYDILDYVFARTGFFYDVQVGGGATDFTFTDNLITLSAILSQISWNDAALENTTAAAIAGQKIKQTFNYYTYGIPITLGLNVPIKDGKYNVYAGLGISILWSGWGVDIKCPDGYIVYDADGDGDKDVLAPAATEKAKFDAFGIGFNYVVGIDAEVAMGISVFVELNGSMGGGMAKHSLKTTAGAKGFGLDTVNYPVNASTMMIKFGAKYHIGFATI